MLSIGVEKLYKVALGLIALEDDGVWISKGDARLRYGHKVVTLHEDVWNALDSRTATSSDYVRGLVTAVHADPVVPPLVAALDRYGREGRFYYIDALGGEAQSGESPESYWDAVEEAARLDPRVQYAFTAAMADTSDNDRWNRFYLDQRERIACAVEGVWVAVADCGRNGALGTAGRNVGHEVHPSMVSRL
jgi:hypothetical protein